MNVILKAVLFIAFISNALGNIDQFTYEGLKGPKVKLFYGDLNFNTAKRSGNPRDTHMCDQVVAVPTSLTFIRRDFYRKFTHAYDIPIISSRHVSDAALKRACYVVRFLLADRPVIRKSLYKNWGRLGVIGINEGTTSIPEHRHLGRWWDERARGLGGTLHIPISTGGEENLLCLSKDRYRNEDIFLHEFSHGIQEVAIRGGAIPSYFSRLNAAYSNAKQRGLWRSTYAMSTVQEYFAEGVQSFFEVNAFSPRPNGVHNHINTRAKLMNYDRTLYNLIVEVFPCKNIIKKRCDKSKKAFPFKMNCDGSAPPSTMSTAATTTPKNTKAPPEPPTTPKITKAPPEPPVSSTITKTPSEPPVSSTITKGPPEPPVSSTTTKTSPETLAPLTITKTPPEPPVPSTITKAPPEPPIPSTITKAPPEPPTITTTTKRSCQDSNYYYCYYNRNSCFWYARAIQVCRKSCGCCNNPQDNNANCGQWSTRGECSRNPRYMLRNCKRSCCNFL